MCPVWLLTSLDAIFVQKQRSRKRYYYILRNGRSLYVSLFIQFTPTILPPRDDAANPWGITNVP